MATKKLTTVVKDGAFVAANQSLAVATSQGFKHVSDKWFAKTMTVEDGINEILKGRSESEDIRACPLEMVPVLTGAGKVTFRYQDGREFTPDSYAWVKVGNAINVYPSFIDSLMKPVRNPQSKEVVYERDRMDAETLLRVVQNGWRRLDPDKEYMFRCRQDGSMRAMLSSIYMPIDNVWFLETLHELVPGGRLSHHRGDSDTIYSNLLIPDTIREEGDSAYGGMLSIGNCEIGKRRLSSQPSVFSYICQNGCVWDQEKGEAIRVVHKGKSVDLMELKMKIQKNLNEQIPLLPQGIDKLLDTRNLKYDGASMKPVYAQLAKQERMSKPEAKGLLEAHAIESHRLDKTLFTVINSVTRMGQTRDNDTWNAMDLLGGRLMNDGADGWNRLVKRAKTLSIKEVEEVFA